jgi:Fe-S-cluster containining protein
MRNQKHSEEFKKLAVEDFRGDTMTTQGHQSKKRKALSPNTKWWHQGIRFQCQGSGGCCSSRGEYGFVYLTIEDRRAIAQHLGMRTNAFTRRYCQKNSGIYHLKDLDSGSPDCRFLKDKKCSIYEARPTQCRTWPFWPENMNAKTWQRDLVRNCPGVGKGRLFKREEIQKTLDLQKSSTQNLWKC